MKKKVIVAILICIMVLAIILGIVVANINKDNVEDTINQEDEMVEEVSYKVTFDLGNGMAPIEQEVEANGILEKPEDPQKEGYIFIEWQKDGEIFDFSQKIKQDINLIAKYQEMEKDKTVFVVKYDSNGGTTISNEVVELGKKIQNIETPIRLGFTFLGWYVDDEKFDFNTPVTNNLNLIAKWEESSENVKIKTPQLKAQDVGGYTYDFSLDYFQYLNEDNSYNIDGFELYSINGDEYIYEGVGVAGGVLPKLLVPKSGYKFVARAYIESEGKKYYSEYSDTITISTTIKKPILTATHAGEYVYDFGLNYKQYSGVGQEYTITGFDLYLVEANGNKKYVTSGVVGGTTWYELTPGNEYKFVARAYIKLESKKYYSAYSDTITVSTEIKKPTLTATHAGEYIYDFGLDYKQYMLGGQEYTITGFDLYLVEANGNKKYVTSGVAGGTTWYELAPGNEYKFVARAYVELKGNKYYSAYSDTITVSTEIKKPTLTATHAGEYIYDFGLDYKQYMLVGQEYTITGFDLYLVEANGNKKYVTSGVAGGTTWYELNPGSEYKFVAKAYVEIKGNKYYSDYSDIITISTKIKKPTLTATHAGEYIYDFALNYKEYIMNSGEEYTITGFELYQVEANGNKKYLTSGVAGGTTWYELNPGSEYKFVAKAYVELKGNKYYSDYSNEIILEM